MAAEDKPKIEALDEKLPCDKCNGTGYRLCVVKGCDAPAEVCLIDGKRNEGTICTPHENQIAKDPGGIIEIDWGRV